MPRGKWYCVNCISKAPPKKPRNKKSSKNSSSADISQDINQPPRWDFFTFSHIYML